MEEQTINFDTENQEFFGYKIKIIILVESHFKRLPVVSREAANGVMEVVIGTGGQGVSRNVELTIKVSAPSEENPELVATVKMAGLFDRLGEEDSYREDYLNFAHGPSLIYPYIREHMNLLFMKAGVTPIILPHIDFTALHEKKEQFKSKQPV